MKNTISKKICYGLLKYSSVNIGDEIQCLAALRFLPQVDYYIRRERISKFQTDCDNKIKLITNAWWMWSPQYFPPSPHIDPLLISMYLAVSIRKKFLTSKVKKYLIQHGPVGCRDYSTVEFLNKNKIPAYFSGCLTLTLEKNPAITRKDFILTVDVPADIVCAIKQRTKRPVFNISRLLLPNKLEERMNIAKAMLYLYNSAHCVVSSRLHVAMPCLALETPILLIDSNDDLLSKDGRYEGLKDLCYMAKEDAFLTDNTYDFECPPPNKKDYLKIRNDLIKRCQEFTGHNSNISAIPNDADDVIFKLIQALEFNKSYKEYIKWWIPIISMVKNIAQRILLRKNRFDLE